jgi:pyruvate ferredoxin oxidoreductase delta subunit
MAKPMDQYTWRELEVGNVVTEPGNAQEYKTGDWRSQRPVFDQKKCIKCGVCWMFCPDNSVMQDAEGFFCADLDYCKGCGICARECWPGAIAMTEEVK